MQKQHHTKTRISKACRKIHYAIKFGSILMLISSCSVLKSRSILKSDSTAVKEEQQKVSLEVKQKQSIETVYLYSDSAKSKSLVSIIPVGEFTYSPDKGFRGKASSLSISGENAVRRTSAGAAFSSIDLSLDSSAHSTVKLKEKISRTEKHAELKNTGGWITWLTGLLLIAGCLVLWFLGRRFVLLRLPSF